MSWISVWSLAQSVSRDDRSLAGGCTLYIQYSACYSAKAWSKGKRFYEVWYTLEINHKRALLQYLKTNKLNLNMWHFLWEATSRIWSYRHNIWDQSPQPNGSIKTLQSKIKKLRLQIQPNSKEINHNYSDYAFLPCQLCLRAEKAKEKFDLERDKSYSMVVGIEVKVGIPI